MAACSIADCIKPVFARSWCSAHYTRWNRHGDPVARLRGEVVNGRKICPGCRVDKLLSEYGSNPDARCLPCVAANQRSRTARNPYRAPRFDATCENCSKAFLATKRRWRYCSPECSDARRWLDNWKNMAARRAREREVTVEKFDRMEIFERDGWICQLCLLPIDPEARRPDVMSASIDHIIPISRGGEHSRANTQAAHLSCNSSKGARILTEAVT